MNGRDALAELLARHDRVEELRAYAAAEYHGDAARRLAELLEERGDVEGAIAVYRDPGDSGSRRVFGPCPGRGSRALAGYLLDLGRVKDAVAVLQRPMPRPAGLTSVGPVDGPPF
ncbi:hypothetical protein ACQEVZ_42885 [Dactylosporangium sp. CA-152071]|uniref:hypothetical protein n=1 Tax=Dactylosporangium sp. CA-152071 TaxID=3239933 RepID=UPI003D8FB241